MKSGAGPSKHLGKIAAIGVAALLSTTAWAALPVAMDVHRFAFIKRESGPVNYYTVVEDPEHGAYLHASYQPPMSTGVMGSRLESDDDNQHARTLRWSWRAITLPAGGNECASGKEDSAAVVYVIWKRGLRYYTLKYVWSGVGPKGAVCDRRRNPFLAQDTVILESGGASSAWVTEQIDLRAEFQKHFEDGDPTAAVPAFKALGIMTDGDQTQSPSVADYGPFLML